MLLYTSIAVTAGAGAVTKDTNGNGNNNNNNNNNGNNDNDNPTAAVWLDLHLSEGGIDGWERLLQLLRYYRDQKGQGHLNDGSSTLASGEVKAWHRNGCVEIDLAFHLAPPHKQPQLQRGNSSGAAASQKARSIATTTATAIAIVRAVPAAVPSLRWWCDGSRIRTLRSQRGCPYASETSCS